MRQGCVTLILLLAVILPHSGISKVEDFAGPETHILVDKKENKFHLATYNQGRLNPFKTFHTTLGLKVGDKLYEGDLKTPEGIYEFQFIARAPQLKPKFGPLALYVGYPNSFDKQGRKTGFDILVHGTDDPSRLERKFDSEGCVVLNNNEVEEVLKNVKMKDTKIVITRDMNWIKDSPRLDEARNFVRNWISAWESKDIDQYTDAYADEFRFDKLDRITYRKYKDELNKKYDSIQVDALNVRYFFHEKYDVVTFDQNYRSFIKGNQVFENTNQKTLYLQKRNNRYQIVLEESRPLVKATAAASR